MAKVISKNSVSLPYVDHIFRQTMRLIKSYELNDKQIKDLLDKFKSLDDIREEK